MAVQLETTISRYRGLSTDTKPAIGLTELGEEPIVLRAGSVFRERDTGDRYEWTGSTWERQEQTIETLFENLTDLNREMLSALRVIQAAVATLANNAWETEYPTGSLG